MPKNEASMFVSLRVNTLRNSMCSMCPMLLTVSRRVRGGRRAKVYLNSMCPMWFNFSTQSLEPLRRMSFNWNKPDTNFHELHKLFFNAEFGADEAQVFNQ